MKKIETGIVESVPRCVLYKEDIERLVEVLTTEDEKPTFQAGGYETTNIEEFYRLLGKAGQAEAKIARKYGDVRVWTTSDADRVLVSASSESVEIAGRVSLAVKALKPCERALPISKQSWFIPATFALFAFGGILNYYTKGVDPRIALAFIVMGCVGFGWDWLEKPTRCRFFGISREDAPISSWAARRRDLLDKLPVLVAGALLALAGQWLLKLLQ